MPNNIPKKPAYTVKYPDAQVTYTQTSVPIRYSAKPQPQGSTTRGSVPQQTTASTKGKEPAAEPPVDVMSFLDKSPSSEDETAAKPSVDVMSYLVRSPPNAADPVAAQRAYTKNTGTVGYGKQQDQTTASTKGKGLETVGSDVRFILSAQQADASVQKIVSNMDKARGFALLPKEDQFHLLALICGSHSISQSARESIGKIVNSKKFQGSDAEKQKKQFESLLASQEQWLPQDTSEIQGIDNLRETHRYELKGPTRVLNHSFKSGTATALRYTVELQELPGTDGKKTSVFVYLPEKPESAKRGMHTLREVADALKTLPTGHPALVKEVHVNPKNDPNDAYYAKQYKMPGYHAYMLAGGEGSINIFPAARKPAQDYMNNTFLHEVGHLLSKRRFGDDESGPGWSDWREAIADDRISPTKYANKSIGEDFSEAMVIYSRARDPNKKAEFGAIMPERFSVLDEMVGGK